MQLNLRFFFVSPGFNLFDLSKLLGDLKLCLTLDNVKLLFSEARASPLLKSKVSLGSSTFIISYSISLVILLKRSLTPVPSKALVSAYVILCKLAIFYPYSFEMTRLPCPSRSTLLATSIFTIFSLECRFI